MRTPCCKAEKDAASAARAADEAHPALFFTPNDVPALRERALASPRFWAPMKAHADELVGPGRIAPESVAKLGDGKPGPTRGTAIGRPLTRWLETLGFVYLITRDELYARAGVELLAAACRDLPPNAPPVGPKSFAGSRGDILRAMSVGYDWLYGAMTEVERAMAAEMMAAYVEDLLAEAERERTWWVPYHNFVGVAIGASGLAAIALRERFPDRTMNWTERCIASIEKWLNSGFDEQGAYLEGVLYSDYGLDNGVLFLDALKLAGGPDLFDNPRLCRVAHFYAMSLLPGERVYDARNDSGYVGLGRPPLLRLAAAANDGLAKWLWGHTARHLPVGPYGFLFTNKVKGVSPADSGEPWAEHFRGRGLVVFRTGWDTGDVMFSVECGPFYPTTHNQADKGHITLYGKGGRWAIDSGYGNDRVPGGRDQTVAHNCVLIDGLGQALSGAGAGTSGRIADYRAGEHVGYALADQTEAYRHNAQGKQGILLQRAHRHCFFVRPAESVPAYALIVDDILVDDVEHQYDWLLHTDERNECVLCDNVIDLTSRTEINGPMAAGREERSPLPTCHISFVWPMDVALSLDSYMGHPRVHAVKAMDDALFIVLLVPLCEGDSKPVASCVQDGNTWEATVGWMGAGHALRGVTDVLRVKRTSTDGAIGWKLRRIRDNSVLWRDAGPVAGA